MHLRRWRYYRTESLSDVGYGVEWVMLSERPITREGIPMVGWLEAGSYRTWMDDGPIICEVCLLYSKIIGTRHITPFIYWTYNPHSITGN